MGDFWQTTLTAIRRGEPDWAAIAGYEGPVRRYLARRYPDLPADERDDLAQDVLLTMRERLVERHDERVGRFRWLLVTAIRNRVLDHLRRRRAGSLEVPEALADPGQRDLDAIDLEARIVSAVRAVHDRYAHGPAPDRELVYVLAGALVHGLSNREIARREGLSADQVKRKLQRAREEILLELFSGLLEGAPASAARCADLTRACLRSPRQQTRLLEGQPQAELVEGVVRAVRDARSTLGSDAAGAVDLVRGIEAIFAS